jgi:hypothetical protein
MSVTGGWMLWLFVDVHVVLESERGNIAWYPYRCTGTGALVHHTCVHTCTPVIYLVRVCMCTQVPYM